MTLRIPEEASSLLDDLAESVGADPCSSSGVLLTDATALSSHPSDSSRVLLGLMALSYKARTGQTDAQQVLDGVIDPGVLRSLLTALHFRDASSLHHVRRTAAVATALARFLGWEGRQLKVLEVAALLHDMGKIGVPDNILFKPAMLSPDEAELMSLHYNIGLDVLQACRVDQGVLDFVSHTHSFYDGGVSKFHIGSETPMGARILTIADAYDSLRSEQIYRPGKGHADVMAILEKHSGTQFDGNIVSSLSRLCKEQGPAHYQPGKLDPNGNVNAANSLAPIDALEASTLCHIFNHLHLLESLYDGFYLIDSDMRVVVWNRGLESLLGYAARDMLGRTWTDREISYTDMHDNPLNDGQLPLQRVLSSGRTITTPLRMEHAEGSWKEVEMQTVPLLDADHRLYGVASIMRDLSRSGRKPQEFRELRMAATRDPLTLVANRGELETQLAIHLRAQTKNRQEDQRFSVIFVDIDHFKLINDTFGHTVGDKVLIELARLMQQEMYSGELVARYGGEEFVILCPDTDLETAFSRAERLRIAISKLVIPDMHGRRITSSFGVAKYETGDSVESLLRRADDALYLSKNRGRDQTNSLTAAQIHAGKQAEQAAIANPFLFTSSFQAVVGSDMVIYKLGGFVTDHAAKLTQVTPTHVTMSIGSVSFFGFWGSDESKQPVELQIKIGKDVGDYNPRSVCTKSEIDVEIRPLGRVRRSDVFQKRAKTLFQELRAFFVAEIQHTS